MAMLVTSPLDWAAEADCSGAATSSDGHSQIKAASVIITIGAITITASRRNCRFFPDAACRGWCAPIATVPHQVRDMSVVPREVLPEEDPICGDDPPRVGRHPCTMRAVIQRVLSASVRVDGEVVGELDRPGLLVYLGVTHDDGPAEVAWTARKIWDLRLLRDEQSVSDVGAPVLVVSQFTLYGDARKGRRPTWQAAAPGPVSEPVYDAVCAELERLGAHVERGSFGADMRVESVNDGPITLMIETPGK
jgi:D-tyrosyl-tRNA(Tyr) deacylase